jgi:hypothetical protein
MIKKFEDFKTKAIDSINESAIPKEVTDGAKILGANVEVDYYVLDIKDLPKNMKANVIIYGTKESEYYVCDKNTKSDDNFTWMEYSSGAIGGFDVAFSTSNPHNIAFMIKMGKLVDKGLTDKTYEWVEEAWATSENPDWDKILKSFIENGPDDTPEKDFELLGVDTEKHRGTIKGKKYGI